MLSYLKVIVIVVCILFSASCADKVDYTKVESKSSPLITGFDSYASISNVKNSILADREWTVVEDSSLPKSDRRPPFNIYTISLSEFTHLGHSGELSLTFFNNRLTSTCFYPIDPEKYLQTLQTQGIDFDSGSEIILQPYTRIRSTKDYRGKVYVDWEDIRLRKQLSRWIMRYS